MKILYDHEVFSYQQYGGIIRYFSELIRNIRTEKDCSVQIGAYFSNNAYLPHAFCPFPFGSTLRAKQLFFRINSLVFRMALLRQDYDLVHFTFYPDPKWRKYIHKPVVITVHDMTPELFPQLFPHAGKWIENKKFWCYHADRIVTVSDHTREDLLRIYPEIDPAKVHRVYLAASLSETPVIPAHLPEKFLLYVGGRKSYKNFPMLLKALQKLPEINLVCTGGGAFTETERTLLQRSGLTQRVHQFSMTDKDLAGTYRRAAALVYPSLYEGFGLPILEAFSAGVPAVLSSRSCFPEIAQNAAAFFDPEDEISLVNALQEVLSDAAYRRKLVEAGTRRAAQFSWKKTAAETLKIYKSF